MHPLLTEETGKKLLLLGNEAIVRGALEAGLAFATTYPGTPSSEIADNFFQIAAESDLYFEYSTNEKVALETAAGAAVCGVRTMCSMKHVGLNVAADPLMTLAYVGVRGGLVIVVADDPSMFSSQNEQDSRIYAGLSNLPMLEPRSAEEAKEMTKEAFDLSEKLELPVLLRTTTRLSHYRGIVTTGALRSPKTNGDFQKDSSRFVTVPSVARVRHKVLLEQAEKAREMACRSSFNTIVGSGPWGIVTSGMANNYVEDAVRDLGIEDKVGFLRLGFTHPFPEDLAEKFIRSAEKILVVEELEPVMENALKVVAQSKGLATPIVGKGPETFSRLYEYEPGKVRDVIARFFGIDYTSCTPIDIKKNPEQARLPMRPPNLCAGCPHRSTYYAVNSVLKEKGVEAVFPTDIGCYTLGVLPPLQVADFLICMGSSVTSAAGISKVTGKKVIAFIGDSTFFHSGITGLINAVHNKHKFILVVLDNGTTAMTGHQPNPGMEITPPGWNKPSISIEAIVRSCGVEQVTVVNPVNLSKTKEAIRQAVASDELSVILAKAPCPLYERRMLGTKPKRKFFVGPECNTDCTECVDTLGCPAMYKNTSPGAETTVTIDEQLCIGCGMCIQICKKIRPKKI
ncbi:MAG: indolepyruvate ferredoxin oxidoreductase subunit alpha [Desulfobacterales bacterium S7086C20]|nr:MAG: indolepyruvate ferredoxin oxidoreductase subunit alpha [Desulfobacterales bacterium S7086C20]